MIDRQLEDLIDERQYRHEKAPTVGRVTKVWAKPDDTPETGNIELNVITRGRSHELRRVPFIAFDHSGHTYVPQKGEHVLVQFVGGRGNQTIATDVVYTREDRAPNALEGHWRHEFESEDGKIYFEAQPADGEAGDPNLVRLSTKDGGLGDAETEVSIDISGGSTHVRVDVGDNELGLEFDEDSGRFTLLDGDGYGIQSDGNGNFTWRHETVDFIDGETIPLPDGE